MFLSSSARMFSSVALPCPARPTIVSDTLPPSSHVTQHLQVRYIFPGYHRVLGGSFGLIVSRLSLVDVLDCATWPRGQPDGGIHERFVPGERNFKLLKDQAHRERSREGDCYLHRHE